jgi:hypothetical protein
MLIVRTACCSRNVLCFTGFGPEDRCSSSGLLIVPETCYVLLVLTSSPHDEHQSSGPRPVKHNTFLEQQAVLTMSTSPPAQDQ